MQKKILFITAIIAGLLLSTTPAIAEPSSIEKKARWLGYQPSLYEGKWHSPKYEEFRKCILHQESRYNYRAANKTSSARGAYQFLDRSWRVSLTYMMIAEEKKAGGNRVAVIRDLRDESIDKWSRYWQDRAFWTAFRHGDGAHHWHLPGGRCNGLA
jgi:hypothetical protein